ncbi:dihydropteroate synthase [beta proteobacterium AAP99]|nr:dihydropteroate synthase [beta proteobacterium AAP99]
MNWQAGRFCFDLQARPLVMGIVNVTPDSFSDGGQHFAHADAPIEHGERLLAEGADLLDIGGESTRPGALAVSADDEWQRIQRSVQHFVARGVCVSVDTMKPEVMARALAAGADVINDVMGFRAPGAIEAVAPSGCGLVVMHMQGEPRTMQRNPTYRNVVAEVRAFLAERVMALRAAGIKDERILLDPGFGFGKSLEHNLHLLAQIGQIRVPCESSSADLPVLAGVSRKSMLGQLTGRDAGERVAASVAAHLLAVQRGARIVRVHDVAATVDALKVWAAVQARRCREED